MNPDTEHNLKFYQRSPLALGLLILAALLLVFVILIISAGVSSRPGTKSVAASLSFGQKVAVMKIEGEIVSSESVLRQLRSYKDNNSVKAVVLRVDSPGGLPAPSQEIYQELQRFKKKKPVVASMGSLAASGAYYVCLPCNYIIASPATLTGSIGVVMQTTDLEELLKWMKVRQGVIKSGPYKDAGSPFRPMTNDERKYFQKVIDNVFSQFKNAVAESRKIKEPVLSQITDGRVFTGEQAKNLGMIDELGNIEDAIRKAGQLAGIKGEPEVLWPMRRYSFWEDLGSRFAGSFWSRLQNLAANPLWLVMPGINLGQEQGASND